jgi:hypothetical protein
MRDGRQAGPSRPADAADPDRALRFRQPQCSDISAAAVLTAVTLAEIERIFEVLERLGISREAVVIPLRPESPGQVRRLRDGRFEIIVEAAQPFDAWLVELEHQLGSLGSGSGTGGGNT